MNRSYLLLGATLTLTAVAGVVHYAFGDVAGSFTSAVPLVLVAPVIAAGTDGLQGRLSPSVVGIVQSGFGNVAEVALTIVALASDLPDVVRIAIAGSLLGNALLLGGIAGLLPMIRGRGALIPLTFDRRLFTGIATLVVVAGMPIGLLSFWTGGRLNTTDQQTVSLVAGGTLLVLGIFFIYGELRRPRGVQDEGEGEQHRPGLPLRAAYAFLASGALVAALTSDWFVSGFEPAVHRIGVPTAFAALVIIPLLGNVAENYVALRYAWRGQGDAAMSVIMHSVVQIATLMTGVLVIVSQFVGSAPLTLHFDPVVAIALLLSLIVLWMIVADGEIHPVEAAGLLVLFVILGAAVWTEGSFA